VTVLGDAASPDVPVGTTVLLPLGAVEQHGPHLPVDTDARIATWLVGEATVVDPTLVAAPPLPYGASGEHEGPAGTVSIGTEALTTVLLEWGRSACRWAARVVVVNGHGGNLDALRRAVPQLRDEGREVCWFTPVVADGDAHAGHVETSLLLHLAPDVVHRDRIAPGDTRPLAELLDRLRREGVPAVSPSGILGDPTTATATAGAALAGRLRDQLTDALADVSVAPDGRLRCVPIALGAQVTS
jgi:mycofactocin precursor peptide peptidase